MLIHPLQVNQFTCKLILAVLYSFVSHFSLQLHFSLNCFLWTLATVCCFSLQFVVQFVFTFNCLRFALQKSKRFYQNYTESLVIKINPKTGSRWQDYSWLLFNHSAFRFCIKTIVQYVGILCFYWVIVIYSTYFKKPQRKDHWVAKSLIPLDPFLFFCLITWTLNGFSSYLKVMD